MTSLVMEPWETLSHRYRTPDGSVYIWVTMDEAAQPLRLFISAGKNGEVSFAAASALAAVVGRALRSGIPVRKLWLDCIGHRHNGVNRRLYDADSVADALGRFLRAHFDTEWIESQTTLQSLPGTEQRPSQ